MLHRPSQISPLRGLRRRRRGFTFTEVMFAVILLGIGFIMLAGMFPVAIRQTQTTQEESHGANLAQSAARYLEQVALGIEYPPTGGQISGLTKDAWLRLQGNLISSQDPRLGWTVLYKRNAGENFMQVVIIAARSSPRPAFDAIDTVPGNLALPPASASAGRDVPNLYPRRLGTATLKKGDVANGIADRISFADEPMLSSGAFVITGNNSNPVRVYRLGNQFTAFKDYDLDPGYGMDLNDPATLTESVAWSLGMGEVRPPGSKKYDGLPMDIAVYVTFVMLK